jgi:group II intron reverse transcriptase/maturase
MGKLLRQIVSLQNLRAAWDEVVDKGAAPGIDGVTLNDFARHWEANLVDLREDVLANRYRPQKLVRFTIPKKDGSPRLLGNLTVRDKVLQRAVLRILDDIYDPIFLDCSYAYRPGRSVKHAVERIIEARELGYTWVLDADIDDFFHNLDHHLIMRFLGETIDDEQLLDLFVAWLTIGRPDDTWPVGTPLGAVISPLLSNIYLHYLDLVMTGGMAKLPLPVDDRRQTVDRAKISPPSTDHRLPSSDWTYIRYSDDFIVLCRSRADAELALEWVEVVLDTLLLQIEPAKTTITTFDEGFEYLGCTFKGQTFYFNYQGSPVKVDTGADWELFYRHGPEEYE